MIMEPIMVGMAGTLQAIADHPLVVTQVDPVGHHTHHQVEQKTNMFLATQEKMVLM